MPTNYRIGGQVDLSDTSKTYRVAYVGNIAESPFAYFAAPPDFTPQQYVDFMQEYMPKVNGNAVTWSLRYDGYLQTNSGHTTYPEIVSALQLDAALNAYGRKSFDVALLTDPTCKTAYPPAPSMANRLGVSLMSPLGLSTTLSGNGVSEPPFAKTSLRSALTHGLKVGDTLVAVSASKEVTAIKPKAAFAQVQGGVMDANTTYAAVWVGSLPSMPQVYFIYPAGTDQYAICAHLNSKPEWKVYNGETRNWSPTGNGFIAWGGSGAYATYTMPDPSATLAVYAPYPYWMFAKQNDPFSVDKPVNIVFSNATTFSGVAAKSETTGIVELNTSYLRFVNTAGDQQEYVYAQSADAIFAYLMANYRTTWAGTYDWVLSGNYLSYPVGTQFNGACEPVTPTDIANTPSYAKLVMLQDGGKLTLQAVQDGFADGTNMANGVLYQKTGIAYGTRIIKTENSDLVLAEGYVSGTETHVLVANIDGDTGTVLATSHTVVVDTDIQHAITNVVSPAPATLAVDDVTSGAAMNAFDVYVLGNDEGRNLNVLRFKCENPEFDTAWHDAGTTSYLPYGSIRLRSDGSLLVTANGEASANIRTGTTRRFAIQYVVQGDNGEDEGRIVVSIAGNNPNGTDFDGNDGGDGDGDTDPPRQMGEMSPMYVAPPNLRSGWFVVATHRGTSLQNIELAPTPSVIPAGSIVVESTEGYIPVTQATEIGNRRLAILYHTVSPNSETVRTTAVVDFSEINAMVLPESNNRGEIEAYFSRKVVIFR